MHPHAGLTSVSDRDAAVKRAMSRAAERTIVLTDHTKLGQVEPHLIAELSTLDTLITDDPAAVACFTETPTLNILVADGRPVP